MVDEVGVRVEVVVLLCVITHLHFVPKLEVAEVRLSFTSQNTQQACFTSTIETQYEQSLASAQIERDIFKNRWPRVSLRQMAHGDDRFTSLWRVGKLHFHDTIFCTGLRAS